METYGAKFLETMKLVFELTQKTGGLYFDEQPDCGDHAELKQDAWEAMGRKREDAVLMSVRGWFERENGKKDEKVNHEANGTL